MHLLRGERTVKESYVLDVPEMIHHPVNHCCQSYPERSKETYPGRGALIYLASSYSLHALAPPFVSVGMDLHALNTPSI